MMALGKVFLYIFSFILIYYTNGLPGINPYIFPITSLVGLGFLEAFSHKKDIYDHKDKRRMIKFIAGVVLSALYFLLVYLTKNYEVTLDGTRLVQGLMFVVYFLIVYILMGYLDIFYKTAEKKMEFLFKVASIQGVICLLMVFLPNLKSLADNLFLYSSNFLEGDYILSSRVYGISNSYTYGLPILHGLLTSICFYYGMMKDKKYLLYLPLIFIVSILNGRTGIIVGIVGIAIVLVYLFIKSKNKNKIIPAILGIALLLAVARVIIEKFLPNVYTFIMSALNEFITFVSTGELSGTSLYLLKDGLILPEGVDLIFGTGNRVYGAESSIGVSSDIGFVNDLFMGGIIYAGILYSSYIALISSTFRKKDISFMGVLIIFALLIANWKGEIFKNATFIIGLFFVVLINMIELKKEEGASWMKDR